MRNPSSHHDTPIWEKFGIFRVGDMVIFEDTGEWCILLELLETPTSRVNSLGGPRHIEALTRSYQEKLNFNKVEVSWRVKWGHTRDPDNKVFNTFPAETLTHLAKGRCSRDGNVVTIKGLPAATSYSH